MPKLFVLTKSITLTSLLSLSICLSQNIRSLAETIPANTESISESIEEAKEAENEALKAKLPEPESEKAQNTTRETQTQDSIESSNELSDKEELEEDSNTEPQIETKKIKATIAADDRDENPTLAKMSQDDSHPDHRVDPQIYFTLGSKYLKNKEYQKALDAFNKALELHPRYFEASYGKALVYQLTGYDKFAARRYADILKYRPDMDQARINLAALHRKHKHFSGAEEQYRAVIEHNWRSFEAHYNLANVLVDLGKPEEALKEYKLCLKMKPNNALVHNNMGVLFLEKKYTEEAFAEFKKAANLAPNIQTYQENMRLAQKLIAEKQNKGTTM